MKQQAILAASGLLLAAAACATPASAAPSEACDTASVQAMAPAGATVAFAAREGAICRISGYVTTTNPGPNRVLFTLALPDNFNGRYVYLGVGGAAGALPVMQPSLLAKGYALAGSDGGTGAKTGSDFSFQTDPAKSLDFSWRGVHVTALATQQITRTYYNRTQMWRYISGCSGGGNMGRTNAQRFGKGDFDGFLVGAVAWPASLTMVNFFRIERHLQTHPEGWISPELTRKASAAILAAYDASDGATDGIIADQRNIASFDINILHQVGFSPAQIDTFNLIRNTYKFPSGGLHGDGTQVGYSMTDISGWSAFLLGRTPPPWPTTAAQAPTALIASGVPFAYVMVDSKARAFAPGVDFSTVTDFARTQQLATNGGRDLPAGDTMDHAKLDASGAKMILYHGSNDQADSYLDTLEAYDVISKRYPNSANWLRTFVIPGMLHCRGGSGPTDADEQLLEQLVAWVEKDQAPNSVTASRMTPDKGIDRRFLICAEPKRAQAQCAWARSERCEKLELQELKAEARREGTMETLSIGRRTFCGGFAAAALAAGAGGSGALTAETGNDIPVGTPVLTLPKIVGPIPVMATSKPYMTSLTPGSFAAGLLQQYDYVEEEYFLFGYANVYGPGTKANSPRTLGETEDIRPLGGLVQPKMPYATRMMVTRPRDNARFSGRVLAYTFHNLFLNTMIEPNFLRNGDAIVAVEGCSGARYGPSEQQRGGVRNLHEFDRERYRDLHLVQADPLVWPNLRPGALGEIMKTWVVGDDGVGGGTQLQEQSRGYAQAPDIMTQMAHALKLNHPSLPFQGKVKRLVTYAASGGSTFLTRYIDYHHEAARLPDGRPAFDGFTVSVGLLPHSRPRDSVLAYILSEGDTGINLKLRDHDPEDTDNPRFRDYQIPGTGHILSIELPGMAVNPADRKVPDGVHYYDKQNKPIMWGVWQNMFDWIEHGKPMPKSARITIDNKAADRIARDRHGNALGGLRTPWVDLPDGTYIGRLEGNVLRAGYRPFGEDKMRQLYGSRARYVALVNRRVDRLVRDGWIMAQDADLMKLKN